MIIRKSLTPVVIHAKDFGYMEIGEDYWNVSLEGIPEAGKKYKEEISTYLSKIEEAFRDGRGLFIAGAPQTGKTALAVIVAKFAYTYWTPATGIKFLPAYHVVRVVCNRGIGKYERCGLLILDDLGSEKTSELSTDSLEALIRFRCDNRLPTIVTTNLDEQAISKKYSVNLLKQIQRKSIPIGVGGVDWAKINSEKAKEFLKK